MRVGSWQWTVDSGRWWTVGSRQYVNRKYGGHGWSLGLSDAWVGLPQGHKVRRALWRAECTQGHRELVDSRQWTVDGT
jgi:hypothetical protein